tara:strand:- start:5239 stop:5994 length:756 start_codon:yes stop_codon:yes gene_type:complete
MNNNKTSIKIGLIVSILIVILILIYYKNLRKYLRVNPVFLKNPMDARNYLNVDNNILVKPLYNNKLSFHFWMYVDNLTYHYGLYKNIFTKGSKGIKSRNQCPGLYISPKTNDITLIVSTKLKNDFFKIENFPLRKWFSIGIVIDGIHLDVYKNGLLEYSKNLSAQIRSNIGDLHIAQYGGYRGLITCIQYFSDYKGSNIMHYKHIKGPYCKSYLRVLWDKLTGKNDKLYNFNNSKLEKDSENPKQNQTHFL